MGFFEKLFHLKKETKKQEMLHSTDVIGENGKDTVGTDAPEPTGNHHITETIRVSRTDALNKIIELHRDKSVQCASLMDSGRLLAKVYPDMTDSDLEYVLMSTEFYLSQCSSSIQIVIERKNLTDVKSKSGEEKNCEEVVLQGTRDELPLCVTINGKPTDVKIEDELQKIVIETTVETIKEALTSVITPDEARQITLDISTNGSFNVMGPEDIAKRVRAALSA